MAKLYRHVDARLDNEIDNIYLSIKDLPIGTIMIFTTIDTGDNPENWPEGWLSMKSSNARVYPKSEYPELSNLLGDNFSISTDRFIVPGTSTSFASGRSQYYIKAK